jgi:hypothetical protein
LRLFAGIAQLVERVIRNDEVVGSIPISGTNDNKKSRLERAAFFVVLRKLSRIA